MPRRAQSPSVDAPSPMQSQSVDAPPPMQSQSVDMTRFARAQSADAVLFPPAQSVDMMLFRPSRSIDAMRFPPAQSVYALQAPPPIDVFPPAGSVNGILRSHNRERLFVQPLYWTPRQLSLLGVHFFAEAGALGEDEAAPSPWQFIVDSKEALKEPLRNMDYDQLARLLSCHRSLQDDADAIDYLLNGMRSGIFMPSE